MHATLALQSSVEEIRNKARQLLSDLRRRDVAAIARCQSLDPQVDPFLATLADVRYLLARKYGYNSWRKLIERLDRTGRDSPKIIPFVLSSVFTAV